MNNRGRVVRTLKFQPRARQGHLPQHRHPPAVEGPGAAGRPPGRHRDDGTQHRRHPGHGVEPELRPQPVRDRHLQRQLLGAAQRSRPAAGEPHHPGHLCPASTVKPMMAVMGLNEGRSPQLPLLRRAQLLHPGHHQEVPGLAPLGPRLARRLSCHRGVGGYLFLRSRLPGRHRQDQQLHDQVRLRPVQRRGPL